MTETAPVYRVSPDGDRPPEAERQLAAQDGWWRLVATGRTPGWVITEARCEAADGTVLTFQVGRARYLEESEIAAVQALPLPAGLAWERVRLAGVYR